MKIFLLIACIIGTSFCISAQSQIMVATDIENFWMAYDKITTTDDSSLQYRYINELYLEKGSEGLNAIVQVKNYTAKEYIDAIKNYPAFWESLRKNSLSTAFLYGDIESDINKLKSIYPNLSPAVIYFTIGAFRSNGTTSGKNILIGCEMALGDTTTEISEFPDFRQKFYNEFKPKENIALLCTHEYVHTQQKELVHNLLTYCIYEGVAEFISCHATGKVSNTPAIAFGKANEQLVINKFLQDIFVGNPYNWLWGENTNELKVRDLGYYIGYEICERYYNLSADKTAAVRELIELDFTNEDEVERIVDQTKLFPKSLEQLWQDYEDARPKVIAVEPFNNKSNRVEPGFTEIKFLFSQPIDTCCQGLDYGPLGDAAFQAISIENRQFSADGKSWTISLYLEPNKTYQYVLSENFRDATGNRLKPYLIEFKTK